MPGRKNWISRASRYAVVVRAERVVEGAVHLVEVEVGGGRAGRLPGRPAAVVVDRLDQRVDLLGPEQPGLRRDGGRRPTSIDADAVVRVEHRDGSWRADLQPVVQRREVACR